MKKTRKIGYLIPEFPGQTHIFFWRELHALAQRGVRGEVVSTRKPSPDRISHEWAREAMASTEYLMPPRLGVLLGGIATLLLAGPSGWWRCLCAISQSKGSFLSRLGRLAMVLAGAELAWLARRRGWEHVHVHSCGKAAEVALFAALLSGLPYSLTLHGGLKDYGPHQRQKWRNAAFAIVITRRLWDEIHHDLDGSLPPRIAIAPMGVNLERFRRAAPYQGWNGQGPCRIFTCGRVNRCKGHDDLIRAVAVIRETGIDVELSIAGADDSGTGECLTELRQLAEQLQIADRVRFLGAVSEDAVRAELENAHVFSLASLHEPLGVAIMEAMALELPVVVTGSGGVPELIDDEFDGLLVPPKDPQGLAMRITQVLLDRQLAKRLGAAGREKIARSFHSGVSASVLAELLAGGTPTGEEVKRSSRAEMAQTESVSV